MKDPTQLTESRIQLHYGIQFVAAIGMAIGEAQPDSSQMTVDWDPNFNGLVGLPIPSAQSCTLALDPNSLTCSILDAQKQPIASLPLVGQTMAEALDWHKAELAKLGAETDSITLLSYPPDFPDHPLAQGAVFMAGDAGDRQSIATYFAHSRPLLQQIVTTKAGASPIHIWPHHFDMATLITLAGSGEEAQTIGVGLSPGDGGYDQPYWYVTPWPYPPQATLPPLSIGSWHTEGWIGAILTATEVGDPTVDNTWQTVETFLTEAVNASYALLT